MTLLFLAKLPVILAVFALLDAREIVARIWHYFNDPHDIAGVEIRVSKLIVGALILAGVLLFSRMVSRLLQRRIARKA